MTALVIYDLGIALTLAVGLALLLGTRDTRVAVGRMRYVVAIAGANSALLAFLKEGGQVALQVALAGLAAVALIEVVRHFGFRPDDDSL